MASSGNIQTPIGKFAEELCKQYTKASTMSLARILFAEFPSHFTNMDAARSMIRLYRNEHGEQSKMMKQEKITERDGVIEMPESFAEKKEPFHIPKSSNKILLLSDIHIPYHDVEAIEVACEHGYKNNIDTIYLNGDITDFYSASFHEKDPRKRPPIAEEIAMTREWLHWLRSCFPEKQIYYITGNHEYRLVRYMVVKAPELLGMESFEIQFQLRLEEMKIHYLPHRSKVYFGGLLIEHGDKLRGAGGVVPARTLLMKFKRPVICGHFHRVSNYVTKVYDDVLQQAWSTGCLTDLEPDYCELNDHVHGAAIIERLENDHYKVENFKINNYKIE